MSVWNRIGDVANTTLNNVTKFTGEVLGAAGGIAKFAWDIGTAPWNDKAEYNGFINTIKSAYKAESANVIKPLASAGGAIMKVPGVQPALEKINYVNREYIREPLTTMALVSGDLLSGRFTDQEVFDPNAWAKEFDKAYQGAQDISFGQATVAWWRNVYDPKFNVYDPREREAAFKKSAWGQFASGSTDIVGLFVGDITLGAGIGIKTLKASELGTGVLKNADAVAKAAEDITKAQHGVKNRFTKVLDDFTANDSVYALNHPMIKKSTQPGFLAHLLGQSQDVKETALILRSAMSDPAALDELALIRADIADAMKAARGDIPTWEEFKLYAAPDEAGMLPFINDNIEIIKEAQRNIDSLAAKDAKFAAMMGLAEGGGALVRTTGPLARGLEDFVAKGRATKFYDKNVGKPGVEVFQPTPFHRLYQKFSWAQGERPSGIIDFNDADSYKEVLANIDILKNSLNLEAGKAQSLLDEYISAATPEERFTAVLNLENYGVRSIAAKYGIDETEANRIYNLYKGARTSAMKSIKDNGYMIDLVDGSKIIKVPVFESQTANFLPIIDFRLLDNALKANSSLISKGILNPYNTVINTMDVLQDLFKAGALLRLGYTIRNGVDSQLRIMAAVGAMTTLRHLGPGLKNLINNTVAVPSRFVDRYRPVDAGRTFSQVQQDSSVIIRELNDLKSKISELEGKVALYPDNLDIAGELNTLKLLREEKQAIYEHHANVLSRSKGRKPKERIGTGSYQVTTSDGQVYILDDAFGGPLADMFRKIASSGNTFERMVDSNTDLYMGKMTSKGIGAVTPDMPSYFDQWAQTLRQTFGNSAVISRIAKGESLEDITRWLRNSPEGRTLRKRLNIAVDESEEYVLRANAFFDNYLPASSGLRGKLKDITANDLRTTFKDPTELPTIHGHILEENLFNKGGGLFKQFVNSAFKFLGTLPEDAWARNPLYIHLYRREAKRRLDVMAGLKKDRLTVEEQQQLMMQSHKVALREMKGILYNIERRSNLASTFLVKYSSPFFSAQENAYKTWLKLAAANPAIVNRGYLVWNSPNQAGLVTDQEGNIVPPGQTTGNDIIWVGLPKGVTKIPFVGKGLEPFTTPEGKAAEGAIIKGGFGIPKQSLDIIFQGGFDVLYNKGNPNVFSDIFPVGPYVAIPASEVLKRKPQFEDALKWALPYGPTKDAISGLLPTWSQRARVLKGGLDDSQFAKSYQLIFNDQQQRAKRNGLPPVDSDTILKMTQDYWKMRIAANLIMPFSPRFDSPYRFYMEKSREYDRLYGMEADAKFLDDYPDFFSFTASLSKNPTNVQSSVEAVKRIEKYSKLTSQLVNIEPRLVGLITNNFSGYEFSQAAYNYLYGKRISADSPEKYLSSQSPAVAQQKNEAEKGWIQYNRFMDAIDNELQDRGLSSTQQKGAEDLADLKTAFINKIARKTDEKGNPILNPQTGQYEYTAWYIDYQDSDGSKTNRVVYGLSKILNNDTFMKDNKDNPTWKSVNAYLDFRKSMVAELQTRQVKGINAKTNQDLKLIYDTMIQKLKQDDKLGFAYIYDRFLSQDLVWDKYLTPTAPTEASK